jgi:hypothetical protein
MTVLCRTERMGWTDRKASGREGLSYSSSGLAVAEVLGVGGGVAQVIGNEDSGLTREFEALAALETGYQIIEADHVGGGPGEFFAVFFSGAAGKLPFLAANLPAHGKFELASAARADELELAGLLAFDVESALVHGSACGSTHRLFNCNKFQS